MTTSVIVVAYNSCAYLPACLDSILRELRPGDEVIVVDNGSSDGTVALLRAQYPHVRLLESGALCCSKDRATGASSRACTAGSGGSVRLSIARTARCRRFVSAMTTQSGPE